MCGVVGPRSRKTVIEKKRLESRAIDGDSPADALALGGDEGRDKLR